MNSILIVFRLLEVTECCGSAVLWTSACPAGDLDADECPGSVGVRPLCAAGYASRSISWLLTLRQQDCSCWNTLGQITLPQEWWLLSSGNLIVTVGLKLLVRHKVLYQVLYVGQEFSWCSQLSPPISPGVPGRQEQSWWNQEAAQLCPGSSAREVKALLVLLSTRIGSTWHNSPRFPLQLNYRNSMMQHECHNKGGHRATIWLLPGLWLCVTTALCFIASSLITGFQNLHFWFSWRRRSHDSPSDATNYPITRMKSVDVTFSDSPRITWNPGEQIRKKYQLLYPNGKRWELWHADPSRY